MNHTPEEILCADKDTLGEWTEDLEINDDDLTSLCQYQEALLDFLIKTKGTSSKAAEPPIASFASVFKECRDKQKKFGKVLDEIKEVLDHPTTQIFQEKMGIGSKRVWKSDDEYEKFKRSLVDSKPSLLVAGSTSCGKSTLVNALLGEDILPFDYNACTAVICEVHHYDCKEKRMYAVVHLPNEKKKLDLDNKAGLTSLQSYASGKEVEGLKCSKIEIFSTSEFLKYFTVVDSPGVTDKSDEGKLTNYFQKKLACGILYLLDAGRSAEEAATVGNLVVSNSAVFPSPSAALFIVSKWDILERNAPAETHEEYKQKVKQNLQPVWRGFTDDQLITFRARIAYKALKLGFITNDMQLLCEKLKFVLIRGIDSHIVRKLQKVLDFVSVVHSKVNQANLLRVPGERKMMPLMQKEHKEKVPEFDRQIRAIWDSVREKVKNVSTPIACFLKSRGGRKAMMKVVSEHLTKRDESALRACLLKSLWDCGDYLELRKWVERTFSREIEMLQVEIRSFSSESGVSCQQPLAEVLKEVVPDGERTVNIDWDRVREISFNASLFVFFPLGIMVATVKFFRRRKAITDFEGEYKALVDRLCQENENLLKELLFDVTKKTSDDLQALEQLSEQQMAEVKQAMEFASNSTRISKSMCEHVQEGCCKLENSISGFILQLDIHEFTESNFQWLNTKAVSKGRFPVSTLVYPKLLLEIPEVLKTEVATTQLLRIFNCRRIGPKQSPESGREHVALYYGSAMIRSAEVMRVGLFFEWCDGGSLAKEIFVNETAKLRLGGFPKAGTYAEEILKGLAYLHTKKVFCQALTPASIMLTGKTGVKVVIPLFDKHSSDQVLHASPELLKGSPPDAAGDIYSFGVILWEIFYGLPYEASAECLSAKDLIDKVTNWQLRPVWSDRELWRPLSEKCLGLRQNRPEASACLGML